MQAHAGIVYMRLVFRANGPSLLYRKLKGRPTGRRA